MNASSATKCSQMDLTLLRDFLCYGSQHTKPISITGATISLLGLLMNCFCYKVSLSLPVQSTSTLLMSYLAIWDSISVIHDGLVDMGLKSFDIYLANYSEFGCKLYYYHSWASTIDASWHLIALALDRAVSIIFPVWHRSLDIARSSRNISWSLTFATYFIVLPNLYFFKIDANNDTCTMIPGNLQQPMLLYIGVITLGLFSFLPFVLIFFANVVFIRKIYILRSEKKDRENQMSVRMSLLRNNTVEQYSLPAMELTEKQPEKSRERDNHNNSNDEKGAEKFNAVTTKNFGDQRVGSSYYEFNPNSAGRPKTRYKTHRELFSSTTKI